MRCARQCRRGLRELERPGLKAPAWRTSFGAFAFFGKSCVGSFGFSLPDRPTLNSITLRTSGGLSCDSYRFTFWCYA